MWFCAGARDLWHDVADVSAARLQGRLVHRPHGAQVIIALYQKNIYASTLQRQNTENSKHIFLEKELRGHSPNFHIHVSVSDLYNPTTIDLPILNICGPIMGIDKSLTDKWMWKLGLTKGNSQKRNI